MQKSLRKESSLAGMLRMYWYCVSWNI